VSYEQMAQKNILQTQSFVPAFLTINNAHEFSFARQTGPRVAVKGGRRNCK